MLEGRRHALPLRASGTIFILMGFLWSLGLGIMYHMKGFGIPLSLNIESSGGCET